MKLLEEHAVRRMVIYRNWTRSLPLRGSRLILLPSPPVHQHLAHDLGWRDAMLRTKLADNRGIAGGLARQRGKQFAAISQHSVRSCPSCQRLPSLAGISTVVEHLSNVQTRSWTSVSTHHPSSNRS